MSELLISTLTGLVYGLAIASLGAIKDCRYEEFSFRKFLRSPIIAALWGAVLWLVLPVHPILTGLATGTLERITVELYKGVRGVKPGKFDYPLHDYRRDWLNLFSAFLFVFFLLLLATALITLVSEGAGY